MDNQRKGTFYATKEPKHCKIKSKNGQRSDNCIHPGVAEPCKVIAKIKL